jgi:hypothetical protein
LTDDIDTIVLSRVIVLGELIKALGGDKPVYKIGITENNMYYGYIKVEIPREKGSTEMVELVGCGHGSFSTQVEAIEKAAEALIGSLKKKFKFEVDDINWKKKNQYNKDHFALFDEVEYLKKKNFSLQRAVRSLRDGWAYTLRLANSVQGMAGTICSFVYCGFSETGFKGSAQQVIANTFKLKKYDEFTCVEGSYALNEIISHEM